MPDKLHILANRFTGIVMGSKFAHKSGFHEEDYIYFISVDLQTLWEDINEVSDLRKRKEELQWMITYINES